MSAEEHYLNAIEALESGDRETAIQEAKSATKIDPEHVDAWQVYSDAALMTNGEARINIPPRPSATLTLRIRR